MEKVVIESRAQDGRVEISAPKAQPFGKRVRKAVRNLPVRIEGRDARFVEATRRLPYASTGVDEKALEMREQVALALRVCKVDAHLGAPRTERRHGDVLVRMVVAAPGTAIATGLQSVEEVIETLRKLREAGQARDRSSASRSSLWRSSCQDDGHGGQT